MIRGAAMNAECKLLKQEEIGDHIMFVGEVTEISADENIKPFGIGCKTPSGTIIHICCLP